MLFEVKQQSIPKALHEKYIVPPFSVFNTRQPYWRERTKLWANLGIGGTNGRVTGMNGLSYDNRRIDKHKENVTLNGTSTFSPVLCEVVYKWFAVPHSTIFDPFAGGITRGAVASMLEHHYRGIDINLAQVSSNQQEYLKLQDRFDIKGTCKWKVDNAVTCHLTGKREVADLVFTCPPYYNLEKYSDSKDDLSNCASYDDFLKSYKEVIYNCYEILKDDSFMVWVVSDVRDKETTEYYGLVADTIKHAQWSGFKFYNEIILYNDTGNLAIVSGDYLERARKVGRQHQNVLVFYKGDTKHIKDKFGALTE